MEIQGKYKAIIRLDKREREKLIEVLSGVTLSNIEKSNESTLDSLEIYSFACDLFHELTKESE